MDPKQRSAKAKRMLALVQKAKASGKASGAMPPGSPQAFAMRHYEVLRSKGGRVERGEREIRVPRLRNVHVFANCVSN